MDWDRVFGIYYMNDILCLMNDEEIQLVVICMYIEFYYSYVKMVLDYGKYVFVEKLFMLIKEEVEFIF